MSEQEKAQEEATYRAPTIDQRTGRVSKKLQNRELSRRFKELVEAQKALFRVAQKVNKGGRGAVLIINVPGVSVDPNTGQQVAGVQTFRVDSKQLSVLNRSYLAALLDTKRFVTVILSRKRQRANPAEMKGTYMPVFVGPALTQFIEAAQFGPRGAATGNVDNNQKPVYGFLTATGIVGSAQQAVQAGAPDVKDQLTIGRQGLFLRNALASLIRLHGNYAGIKWNKEANFYLAGLSNAMSNSFGGVAALYSLAQAPDGGFVKARNEGNFTTYDILEGTRNQPGNDAKDFALVAGDAQLQQLVAAIPAQVGNNDPRITNNGQLYLAKSTKTFFTRYFWPQYYVTVVMQLNTYDADRLAAEVGNIAQTIANVRLVAANVVAQRAVPAEIPQADQQIYQQLLQDYLVISDTSKAWAYVQAGPAALRRKAKQDAKKAEAAAARTPGFQQPAPVGQFIGQ
jgi:hypothetical protein